MKYEVEQDGPNFKIKGEWMTIKFDEFPYNCGVGLMHHFYDTLMDEDGKNKLKAIMDYAHKWLKEDVCYGAIICVLGNNYYRKCDKALISLGFERVSQYRNWAHDKGSQRCYIYKIK